MRKLKPKKLSQKAVIELQAAHTTLQAQHDNLKRLTNDNERRIADLQMRLVEARRRTIPFGDPSGKNAINLLPLFVEEIQFDTHMDHMRSMSGMEMAFPSHRTGRATIIVGMTPGDEAQMIKG